MSNQLGPIDLDCDAPPYPIVHACERLGFESPLDVRWCCLSHCPAPDQDLLYAIAPWKWFAKKGWQGRDGNSCFCGAVLPVMENFAFTLACERVVDFRLGQCRRCKSIFWEEG